MKKVLIPERIRVGYQKRSDTYTKKLAYIIYYDGFGKLRKEKSWESWRHKDIEPEEFDNKPHSGFVLNKGVQRYGHWSSGRSMVRVYDDRGMEFEITVANLMFILMTTDCLKRGLEGEFVYAWSGTELILLPTGCEEYPESRTFTKLQTKKIGVKDLVEGVSYKNKKMEDLIYMGRFDWYTVGGRQSNGERKFIFYDPDKKHGSKFIPLNGITSLAAVNSDVPVSDYAELMDQFNSTPNSSRIVGLGHEPVEVDLECNDTGGYWCYVHDKNRKDSWGNHRTDFIVFEDSRYVQVRINMASTTDYPSTTRVFQGFKISCHYRYEMNNGVFTERYVRNEDGTAELPVFAKLYKSLDELKTLNFVRLKTILENGKQGTYLE